MDRLLLHFPMDVISQPYGARPQYYISVSGGKLKFHEGLDIRPSTAMHACYDGVVVSSQRDHDGWGAYGKHIKIKLDIPVGTVLMFEDGTEYTFQQNDTLIAQYAHLAVTAVSPGQHVEAGRWIGTMGTTGNSTGVHLHFDLELSDAEAHGIDTAGMNKIDPTPFLFGGVPFRMVDVPAEPDPEPLPDPIATPIPYPSSDFEFIPAPPALRAKGYDYHGPKQFIANDASFLILKATEGESWKDAKFLERARYAAILGIPVLGYIYYKADDDQTPEEQVDNYLEQVDASEVEIYRDIVDFETIGNTFNGNEAEGLYRMGIRLKEKRGRKPLVYFSPGEWDYIMSHPDNKAFSDKVDWNEIFDLYIAHWNVTAPRVPKEFKRWVLWQTKVEPVNGLTTAPYDHDVFIGDETNLYEWLGFDPAKDRLKFSPRITALWGLRVRSGAGTEHSQIGWAQYGNKYPIFDIFEKSTKELWFKIQLPNGSYGWVAGSYYGDIYAKLEKDE